MPIAELLDELFPIRIPADAAENLAGLYHRAEIPEYWLIDALGEEIDFRILRRGSREYLPIEADRGWLPSPLFGRSFKLVREIDEEDDVQYGLHSKK